MAGVWTNNWRAFRNIMLMGCCHNGMSTITNTTGVTVADKYDANMTATTPTGIYSQDQGSNNSACSIRLGTGNTAPAATDYNLAEPSVLSYLTLATADPVFDDQNGAMSRTVTMSVQNQTGSEITIREWGLFGSVRTSNYYSSSYSTALLYREVLSTPVALAPYQTATVQVTVNLTLTDPVA